jgi:mono/diheme cytochrome c family protein
MKTFVKILAGLVLVVLLFAAFIQFAPLATNDILCPPVTVSTDSTMIARGEYLTFGPAHCFACHGRGKDSAAIKRGEKIALTGGNHFAPPFGNIYIPNLTPDLETGIGKIKNGAIARAMRFATNHNGNTMIPIMPFTQICDYDVAAIISYLRAQKPVHNPVPPTEYSFVGKVVNRYFLKPYKQTEPIAAEVEVGPTVEYGKYLANNVANCKGCHTIFNMQKMEHTGVSLAGRGDFEEKKHHFKLLI